MVHSGRVLSRSASKSCPENDEGEKETEEMISK